jgi:osmotically-inducible protein OsmY
MKIRRLTLNVITFFVLVAVGLVAQQTRETRGGRYDAQIEQQVSKRIDGKKQYRNVRFGVDDGVVTLEGNVELHSQRTALENDVRKMGNVEGVRSFIVLNPTPVADEVLFGRIRNVLRDANLEQLKVQAHEGRVVVEGDVQNRRQWSRVVNAVWDTPGVKEAEFNIRILGEQR